jgi:hypothetical protein
VALSLAAGAIGAPLRCDMTAYESKEGLQANLEGETLTVTWQGERGASLRARFGLDNGQPTVRELEVRGKDRNWSTLATNLSPEFHVSSGRRRISNQQLEPVRGLGREITPELVEREKWNVFWDAPLVVPGVERTNLDMPRSPGEIRRASSSFNSTACQVKTDGARLEVSFPGLSLGIFSGRLQFTVYRGTNLLRMEAIAKTEEPSVAYAYSAGLKGFATETGRRVIWRDVARAWQKYEFGGAPNDDPVALRARNRVAIVESQVGSIAVFPSPHKFFFAREIELNLGYVWYRKDDERFFSVGVRQAEREEMFRPRASSPKAISPCSTRRPEPGSAWPPISISAPTTDSPRRKRSWRSPTATATSRCPATRSPSATSTRTSPKSCRTPAASTCSRPGFPRSGRWASTSR